MNNRVEHVDRVDLGAWGQVPKDPTRSTRFMSLLRGGDELYAFHCRVGRASFHSVVEGEGERDLGSVRYVSQRGRPVELHVRIVALGGRDGRGFGLVAFRPVERHGVAKRGVEREIASRGDDCHGLLDFAALRSAYVHERINLRQNARIAHVRPAELLHVCLQFLECLNADAKLI